MYKSFRVKNFRCFKDLQINDLGRVNLIAGKNNTGKTALMEALFLQTKPIKSGVLASIQDWRDIKFPDEYLESYLKLFCHRYDAVQPIILEAHSTLPERQTKLYMSLMMNDSEHSEAFARFYKYLRDGGMSSVEAQVVVDNSNAALEFRFQINSDEEPRELSAALLATKDQPILTGQRVEENSIFLGVSNRLGQEIAMELLSKLRIDGTLPELIEALQAFEPDLGNLHVLRRYGEHQIWVEIGNLSLPLKLMGEGVVRFTHIILTMLSFPSSVLLIDEIENGIHHSVQCKVWQAIGKVARELDIQVFATTHSLEMIRAAYEAFSADDSLEEFRYHRLYRSRKTDDIKATTYNELDMEAVAAFDFEHEVR